MKVGLLELLEHLESRRLKISGRNGVLESSGVSLNCSGRLWDFQAAAACRERDEQIEAVWSSNAPVELGCEIQWFEEIYEDHHQVQTQSSKLIPHASYKSCVNQIILQNHTLEWRCVSVITHYC